MPYLGNVYYIKLDLLFEVCHYGTIYNADGDLRVSFALFSKFHQYQASKLTKHAMGELTQILSIQR